MKYLRYPVILLATVVVLASGLFFVSAQTVAAAPSKKDCYDTFNSQPYPGTDKQKKDFNKSGCKKSGKDGFCAPVANKTGRGAAQHIECDVPAAYKPTDNPGGGDSASVGTIPEQTDPAWTSSNCTSGGACNLMDVYINPFIKFLSAIVGLAVVIGIIWGAIEYSSSAGDPQKVAQAKDKIRNALIALVAFIFLFAFLNWLMPGAL